MASKRIMQWRVETLPDSSRVMSVAGYLLATCVGPHHLRNARLTAAAPDLYYIARFVARETADCKCGACAPCLARMVIRRVEG